MSLKKNIIYNITYQILILFLPLVTTPYISRVIGAEGVGIYSYTYSIANYFILFAMLGLNNYGNRSIATVRDDKIKLSETFFSIYGLQLLTASTMVISYFIYTIFWVSDHLEIVYIQLIFIISAMLDINWFFFGLEQFKLTVVRNTIIKIITVVSIFTFVKDSNDLWLYTLIMALGNLLSQMILWPFIRGYVFWVRPTFTSIRNHLKSNLILFIPVLSISIYKIMDKIMLGKLTSTIQVGYYENSEKIISIPISFVSAVGVVMLPKMTNLIATEGSESFKRYIEVSLKFVMFVAVGASIGLISISSQFIPLFLGDEFTNCIMVVSLLSVTVLFISWANVIRTQYLIPTKKDSIYIKSTLLGALINVIANLIFISSYGAIGAAIGTIFAEASVALYQTFKVREDIDIKRYFKNSCIYVIPAICMYFCIMSLKNVTANAILNLLIQIMLGAFVYIVLSGIFLYFIDQDIRIRLARLNYKIRKV